MIRQATQSRRSLFAGFAAAAVMSATCRAETETSQWAKTVDAHIRMRSGQGGRAALYFNTGDIWASRPGNAAIPLFAMEICSFARLAVTPDGNLEHISSDLGAFKDPTSGAYLTKWTNPFNGKECDVPLMGRASVSRAILTPDGHPLGLSQPFNGSLTLGGPVTRNGIVWVKQDAAVVIPRPVPSKAGEPPTEKMVSTTSLATYSALDTDLARASAQFVPVRVSGTEVSDWWPWMNMDGIEGFMTWRIFGSKLRDVDALSAATRAFLERAKPGWITAPGI